MRLKGLVLGGVLAGCLLAQGAVGSCMELPLETAVQLALKNNPDVLITQLGEETAKASLRQARGQNSFSWKASSSFSRSESNSKDWENGNSNKISVSLPLYSGGANQNSIKSGELGVDIARLKTERKWETTRLAVIQAYYDTLEAQKKIAVYQDTVDKYQQHLTNVEQLYGAGSKAKIDVLRSQVELSNARQELIKGKNSYDNNLSTLRSLIYVDSSEPLELTDDFSYTAFDGDVGECLSYALDNRKEILMDNYQLQQKELAVRTAKAGYGPTVDLSVGAGWSKQVLPDGDNHEYTASLGVSWNIFDSGITAGKVDAAKAELAIAQATLAKDRNDIDLAVRKDYNSMREAEERFNSTQTAVKQAEEDFFIAQEKYKAGEGIMLDIIDAQEALSTARHNYISAQYDYARYKAALESDMGLAVEYTAGK
ncbi:TolC family protein [Anaerovibrio sp.]|uniref:TolC family protein n=1 Tax=Anaerovibrio sp. TaxID=1872532 RepID=UPI003F1375CE